MQLTEANPCGSDSPKFVRPNLKVCAIIDSEIVCLDENGVSTFNWLLSGRHVNQAILDVFDLLWINSVDLRRIPLVERKARLCELARRSACPRLLYAQHLEVGE